MQSRFFLSAAISLLLVLTACSNSEVRTVSPDGNLEISLLTSPGRAEISVDFCGKKVIEPSRIGLILSGKEWGSGVRIIEKKKEHIVEDFDMLTGKTSHVHSESNQLSVLLADSTGRQAWLVLRAFNDGVAYRYVFPEQEAMDSLLVNNEILEIRTAGNPAVKALHVKEFHNTHEGRYTHTSVDSLENGRLIDMPLYLQFENGVHAAITEAMLVDYAGMYLVHQDGTLNARLSPRLDRPEFSVIADLPHRTPWRVFMVSSTPAGLMESNILVSLCDPCTETDLSWIKPGKTTWNWWNGFRGPDSLKTKDADFLLNCYYIDFCAENGIDFHALVEYDGGSYARIPWYFNNAPSEFFVGDQDDPSRPHPKLKMEEICAYAASKGVGMRVWVHWEALMKDIDKVFSQYEKWGLKGLMVDFMDRDDQQMIEIQKTILEKAMKYHLHIQFHGSSKPSGLSRTYPAEFTREGADNYERYKWENPERRHLTARHDLTIPFTRALAGPVDYHLGGFSSVTDAEYEPIWKSPVVTFTRAHMLAQYVVLESALQLVADAPEAYRGQDGFDFIREVPVVWDETKVLVARPDETVVIARRNGSDWFIGGIGNGNEVSVKLSFLDKGRYTMTLYRDADDADREPNHVVIEVLDVDDAFELSVPMATNGGFAARISPIQR